MRPLVFRQGSMFKIDLNQLPTKAKNNQVINALYADIYLEFLQANSNPKYARLTVAEKLQAVNTYATNWLKDKGFN
jgi:hypothetical protein